MHPDHRHRLLCLLVVVCSLAQSMATDADENYVPVEQVQEQNFKILAEALHEGWQKFCDAPVDEGVMSLYPGINPSDATIHVMTITNQTIELPIQSISELRDFDLSPKRKTLIYVNGYYTSDSYFSVLSHLRLLQKTRRDLNVILVDFARNVQQLYYAVRHHVTVQGYFVSKIVAALVAHGLQPQDIILAGHSVGANIAALGANNYAEEQQPRALMRKIGTLVAIDPALMCQPSDIYVAPNVSTRVVVIHGEGDLYGVREPLGTIDIYPNGVGFFPRRKPQPGCVSNMCSHMYSFVLFMEALIEKVMIPAVKCDSWWQFRQRNCNFKDTIAIGLNYPAQAAGIYFCQTQPNPPFTYMEHGMKFNKKEPTAKHTAHTIK